MANYIVQKESLETVADSIRAKAGISEKLVFPDGWKAAVEGITGGGNGGGRDPYHCIAENVVNINVDVSPTHADYNVLYEVVPVDGAPYGFSLNENGYYESQNKGISNSYAMCKVIVNVNTELPVYFQCINYAQTYYDYGLISEPNTMLAMNNTADSDGVAKSFYSSSGSTVQNVAIKLPAGESFFCVKFIKNGSTNSNNDSLQFKLLR